MPELVFNIVTSSLSFMIGFLLAALIASGKDSE